MLLFNYHSLLLKEFIFSSNAEALKATLLVFYSTMAGSMAALFVVSGIFLMFRLESIQSEINIGIDNFRNWVALRIKINDPEITTLKINQEPHSWLVKDVLDHIEVALKIAVEKNHLYTRALTDYFNFITGRLNYQTRIKILGFIPFILIGYIFLNSLYNLAIIDLLICKYRIGLYVDIASSLGLTFFVLIYLLIFMFLTILGPRNSLINTPKTR